MMPIATASFTLAQARTPASPNLPAEKQTTIQVDHQQNAFNATQSRAWLPACHNLHRVQLRCDSKSKFPDSCSRCHTRGLVCTVDSSFKRVPARQYAMPPLMPLLHWCPICVTHQMPPFYQTPK
ncbi:hypothetical protein LIA77_03564 [Sarocladium implicatum]|nr:hypothetical protein LIA77_03564 [Sarocladium implicatum]